MKPYYDEDGITIYHGDCRDVLPLIHGDVIATDPPYGVQVDYDGYDDTPDNLRQLIDTSYPLMRAAAPLVAMTTGVKHMWKWPEPDWAMCWFEAGGSGVGPWGFTTWQPILVYGRDPYLARGLGSRPDGFTGLSGAIGRGPIEDRFDVNHPVAKPLAVARWIVGRLAPEPSVVIDPFMGGGSFVRAARDLGHRAIGIEQSERYCEIAVQRLAQGVLPL